MVNSYSTLILSLVTVSVFSHDFHPRPGLKVNKEKSYDLALEDKNFWLEKGDKELDEALSLTPNTNIAKNIIIFIGDGMSLPTVTAARVYKGQKAGSLEGSSASLSWESFPYVGLSKTYNSDYMVSDSASTAFAMYSGVKTAGYTMGYDNTIVNMKLDSVENATEVDTILHWAQAAGKKTGFVTNTRMGHATPAALYAKTVSRFWECENDWIKDIADGKISQADIDKFKPTDITQQLVESEAGKKIDIMLGGGKAAWMPRTETRWDYDSDEWNCTRWDRRNLIEEWKENHTKGVFIENKTELMNLDMDNNENVLGIFTNTYVTWDDLVNDTNEKPYLSDMATQAVKFLQKKSGDEGFFVMIEGGKIDQAHHNGRAVRALSETLAFDKAVEEVLKLVSLDDTLVIVTADHAHTMSIGGYAGREIDITGIVIEGDGDVDIGADGKNYTILNYGNGPGFMEFNSTGAGNYTMIERSVLAKDEVADLKYKQGSAAPLSSETHGGDDVGIWAAGPMAHLFHGVHEQSYIGHVMSYAACIGPQKTRSRCLNNFSGNPAEKVSTTFVITFISLCVSLSLYW